MPRQSWSEAVAWSTADGTAVSNTTTEGLLFPVVTFPGGYLQDGRALRLIMKGRVGATGTPTLTFAVRWGGLAGTVLCQGVVNMVAMTAGQFHLEVIIQTRTNGATGTVYAMGIATVGDDAAPTVASATAAPAIVHLGSAGVATPAAVTVDLTAATDLAVTADWSAADALNTITGHINILEVLN